MRSRVREARRKRAGKVRAHRQRLDIDGAMSERSHLTPRGRVLGDVQPLGAVQPRFHIRLLLEFILLEAT